MPNYTTSFSATGKKTQHRRGTMQQLPTARRRQRRRPGVRYLNHSQGFGRRSTGSRPRTRRNNSRKPYAFIAVGCAFLFFVASVVWYMNRSVDITLNGDAAKVRINSTIAQVIEDKQLDYRPGDLLAVDDTVLKKRGGERYSVKLNGKQVAANKWDDTELVGGEKLEVGNGRDRYEDHEVQATELPPTMTVKGTGAIQYVETWGIPGRAEVWVGKTSGKTVDRGEVKKTVNCEVRATSVSPSEGSYVALTFDEGPSTYTKQILDILKEKGASATFFLQGETVEKRPDAAKAIVRAGFEIGSNSYADEDLTALSADQLRGQLTRGFDAIEQATGVKTGLLRAPYCLFSENNWAAAMDLLSGVVSWNVDSGDWLMPGADAVVATVMGAVGNGNIILLSDNDTQGAQTVEALPALIDQLAAKGYKVVGLSDLIATDKDLAETLKLGAPHPAEGYALPVGANAASGA